jgi:phi LC3 family holin
MYEMININLKTRFRNKAFLLALVSAIVLILKNCGFGEYIPPNLDAIVNSFMTLGLLLGVIIDPSTKGISDQTVASTTVQAVNDANTKVEIKAEAITTAINNTVSENSQDVTFDNVGMTAPGDLKVVYQDGTSQIEVKNDSINSSVQSNEASSKVNVDVPVE